MAVVVPWTTARMHSVQSLVVNRAEGSAAENIFSPSKKTKSELISVITRTLDSLKCHLMLLLYNDNLL